VIVVDTSAWIANIRNQAIRAVEQIRDPVVEEQILIGDIVVAEVLQGARDDRDAARLERDLRRFPIVTMGGEDIAIQAARHYRLMRASGFTPKLPDLFIGSFCIAHGHELLQSDTDFEPMAKICGLRLLR
jgi:predicted nucleic acid-binding protein